MCTAMYVVKHMYVIVLLYIVLSSLVREQLLSKEEHQRVVDSAFDQTIARKWEAALLQLQKRKSKPTLVRTEEILQSLPQDVP